MIKKTGILLLAGLSLSGLAACGEAQKPAPAGAEEEQATIASLTENSDRMDGLFTVFVDRDTGEVRMLIEPANFDREFLYVATVQDAPLESGRFRGQVYPFGVDALVTLRRHYKQVEFVKENVQFYVDPASALSRAGEANISHAVMAVAEILAEDADTGAVLIDAGPVFLSESLSQVKPTPDPKAEPGQALDLGSLSEEKTRFTQIRSYPGNADFFVQFVFENPAPLFAGEAEITDPRYVSIQFQHSLVLLPENNFKPRFDDPRVGYFTSQVTEMADPSASPWRDVIKRWDLQKKDPDAAVSDPLQPIVFWLENSMPEEYRDDIRNGTLAWNKAFESAGFSNAIEVRIQPDDADWDAGDIHYNVIRWQASPTPPFGGYGPHFADPRTGQILGTDIMLDHAWVTNRIRTDSLFGDSKAGAMTEGPVFCRAGEHILASRIAGQAMLAATGAGADAESQMLRESLYELALHEVGHTLGLNHNFRASQMLTPAQLYDPTVTRERGLKGSVMDYTGPNLAPPGKPQGLYYDVVPGPYDHWAIEYGYSPGLTDPAAEKARLEKILSRSTEPELAFGNDADDMRSVGAGIDPTIMIFDYSNDAIRYAADRFDLVDVTMETLLDKYRKPGETYSDLAQAHAMLMIDLQRQATAVSRYVGGVLIDRAVVGQPGATEPFRPVSRSEQKRAMDFMAQRVFAIDAFQGSAEVYRHLQVQRRGFELFGKTADPKIHAAVLAIQAGMFDHLLNPVVLTRISDTALYGNQYPLSEMFTDLSNAVFQADLGGSVNGFRQNLQSDYVNRLVAIAAPGNAGGYDSPSRSMALYELIEIRRRLASASSPDRQTRAHRAALTLVIDRALDAGAAS
ncbi:MAG: zinc-dependent metalloprotease [Gammaproteobacteria bacterium]